MKKRILKLVSVLLALAMALSLCACGRSTSDTAEEAIDPAAPVIGISWNDGYQDYSRICAVIREAGGTPVELPQITSTAVTYDEDGAVTDDCLAGSGMLKQEYADAIKEQDFDATNLAEALEGVDAVLMTGGENISPSLYAVPQAEENDGEVFNATRDVSDYLLMAYCIEQDMPTLCICRSEEMLGVVSGATIIQHIPDYYASLGVEYNDTHREPVKLIRNYARHDIDIVDTDSLLYAMIGSDTLEDVASWHHQAILSVDDATGLKVTATASDDGVEIIESVERTDRTFIVGIQFHAEYDCAVHIVDGKEPICDYDACMGLFETLVLYAGGGSL